MFRQVGDLKMDNRGIAERGLLVRHLVLPHDLAGRRIILKFIAENISKKTYINIMDQYRPEYNAWKYKKLSRSPTLKEYENVVDIANSLGLETGESFRHQSILKKILGK